MEYGDLRSSSFNNLWNALQDFRRARVSDEYTSALLQASPWIRPEYYLEAGDTLDEFLDNFPTVSRADAIAALEEAKGLLTNSR